MTRIRFLQVNSKTFAFADMQSLLIFLGCSACVLVLISVHELGHYLAGMAAGISPRDMRIRLLAFSQHVVLRDADGWVSPATDIERYVELTWQYLSTKSRVYLYVCGGLALETLFTGVASVALILLGFPYVALAVAGLALMMFLPWVFIDTIAIVRGRVSGDISGLWLLARLPTAILVLVFVGVRGDCGVVCNKLTAQQAGTSRRMYWQLCAAADNWRGHVRSRPIQRTGTGTSSRARADGRAVLLGLPG